MTLNRTIPHPPLCRRGDCRVRDAVVFAMLLLSFGRHTQAAEDPYGRPPFAVPPRLGAITDYWRPAKGAPTLRLEREPLVVMIQDLHANVGVQKNIAAVLYRLNRINRDRGLLVCVEGASGEGDVSLLRSLPGPIRHGFEAMLLQQS